MTILTENPRAGSFLLSLDDTGNLSRDNITVKSGAGVMYAGTVLAAIVAATVTSAAKSGGNTGNGTFVLDGTTPLLERGKPGVYKLRCVTAVANGGVFRLEGSDGVVLGDITIPPGAGDSVTLAEQIKGVLTDGATDFIVGDGFDITVVTETEKYVQFDETGTDGSEIPAGVLYSKVDATSADAAAVAVKRHAEVYGSGLIWKSGATTAGKNAAILALKAQGILVR